MNTYRVQCYNDRMQYWVASYETAHIQQARDYAKSLRAHYVGLQVRILCINGSQETEVE